MPMSDHVGEKFNHLEIVSHDVKSYFMCLCECGKTKRARLDRLKSGTTKDCGCGRKKEINSKYTGLKVGRLTVISCNDDGTLNCRCDCGNAKKILKNNIYRNNTRSCGCLHKERTSLASKTHGLSHTLEYNSWIMMKNRCLNPNAENYAYYGGRGIKICQEWIDDFSNFINDMGEKPSPSHSLDRIDFDGDYTKENCRWADKKTQSENRSPRGTRKNYNTEQGAGQVDAAHISMFKQAIEA